MKNKRAVSYPRGALKSISPLCGTVYIYLMMKSGSCGRERSGSDLFHLVNSHASRAGTGAFGNWFLKAAVIYLKCFRPVTNCAKKCWRMFECSLHTLLLLHVGCKLQNVAIFTDHVDGQPRALHHRVFGDSDTLEYFYNIQGSFAHRLSQKLISQHTLYVVYSIKKYLEIQIPLQHPRKSCI